MGKKEGDRQRTSKLAAAGGIDCQGSKRNFSVVPGAIEAFLQRWHTKRSPKHARGKNWKNKLTTAQRGKRPVRIAGRCAAKEGYDQHVLPKSSPDSVCFSADMPLAPSLLGNIQMPTLNRLRSHEWPLLHRLKAAKSGSGDADGVCIAKPSDQGKTPGLAQEEDDAPRFVPSLFRSETNSPYGLMGDGRTTQFDFPPSSSPLPRLFLLPPQLLLEKRQVLQSRGIRMARGSHQEARPPSREMQAAMANVARVANLLQSHGEAEAPAPAPAATDGRRAQPKAKAKAKAKAPVSSSRSSQGRSTTGCSCKRSQCRKKYCLCFSNGAACSGNCRCQNCGNTEKDGLFNGQYSRRGCRCDSSLCKKKYCICFQAGNRCSPFCKCRNCHNGKDSAGSASAVLPTAEPTTVPRRRTTRGSRAKRAKVACAALPPRSPDRTDEDEAGSGSTKQEHMKPLSKRARRPAGDHAPVLPLKKRRRVLSGPPHRQGRAASAAPQAAAV